MLPRKPVAGGVFPGRMISWTDSNDGAWTSLAALSLTPHALAPLEIVPSAEMICDLTLDLGKVMHDYLR